MPLLTTVVRPAPPGGRRLIDLPSSVKGRFPSNVSSSSPNPIDRFETAVDSGVIGAPHSGGR